VETAAKQAEQKLESNSKQRNAKEFRSVFNTDTNEKDPIHSFTAGMMAPYSKKFYYFPMYPFLYEPET
jgi:hypothetical protein